MDNSYFKKLLSFLESSNGTNTDHPEMTTGMHEGTKAMGEYGVMPITAQEVAKSRINKGEGSELDKIVQQADPRSVEEILQSNPEKYEQYVNSLSDKMLNKSQGNPEEAAMRWFAGPNSSPKRLRDIASEVPSREQNIEQFMVDQPGMSQDKPYVQKLIENQSPKETLYNKIRNRLGGL